MKKFFERNILDELYESKESEFADNILEKMQERNEKIKSLVIEEKLKKKIEKSITNERIQSEVLKILNEYELERGKEDSFWNKMYYKLGAYDSIKLKEILKNEVEEKTTVFNETLDDFYDNLISSRIELLKENTKYKEIKDKIEKIKKDNPNVRTFIEVRKIVELSDMELKAILDILSLQQSLDTFETIETFKLGIREMILFLRQMKLL